MKANNNFMDNIGYNGATNIKRDGVVTNFTEYQLEEYKKCMNDVAYFAKKYVKVIDMDMGLVPFNLYDYQKNMYKHFDDNRFSIVLASRQSGKSISTVIYILHCALFTPDKNIALLANKASTAKMLLARVSLALENIPMFLQTGVKALNKTSIEFSNNSRIFAAATSSSSIRGESVSIVVMDEFAFIDNDAEFYTSTYPVISSGKSTKIIITSTANGIGNMFHKLWEGAVAKKNEYAPFRVDWWDVPGRDEKWKEETIKNTSLLQFNQEFGNDFMGNTNTLFATETLFKLQGEQPIWHKENVSVYKQPEEGHKYILIADVSQGIGQDYSTFTIIDVVKDKKFEQVAVFRDNTISPMLFPNIIAKYAHYYNEALVMVENNDAGQVVCNGLFYDVEYPNIFMESRTKRDGIGVRMTKKTKKIGCSNIKDIVDQGYFKIPHQETIDEMTTFVTKGTSYAAKASCHDDLVMNLVLFGWFTTTNHFLEYSDIELKQNLYKQQLEQIEANVPCFGIISTHGESQQDSYVDEDGLRWTKSQ